MENKDSNPPLYSGIHWWIWASHSCAQPKFTHRGGVGRIVYVTLSFWEEECHKNIILTSAPGWLNLVKGFWSGHVFLLLVVPLGIALRRVDKQKHFSTQFIINLWNSLPQLLVMATGLGGLMASLSPEATWLWIPVACKGQQWESEPLPSSPAFLTWEYLAAS